MTRALEKCIHTRLAGLLLTMCMATTSWAQQPALGSYQALADEVITKLDEFENSGSEKYTKWRPELQRLQFKIKQYQALANSELEHAKELQKDSLEFVKLGAAELERLDAEAIKSQGMRIQSAETIELLLRNCLIEINRLELEKVTAKKLVERKAKPGKEFDADRLRIQAEEASLTRMRDKLEDTRKQFERNEGGKDLNLMHALRDQETELDIRATKLQAMVAEFRAKMEGTTTSSEDQFKDLELRHAQLISQIKDLDKQQEWAKIAKQINAQIELAYKRMREAEDSVLKSAAKIREMEALNQIINNVVDLKKKKE